MNLRLTSIEAKDLHDQIARLGTFMALAGKLGWQTRKKAVRDRLRAMWWKYHEK